MNLDELWDFEDPAGSERRFRAALADATGDEAAILRSQLARSLGLQGRFDEAHHELDQVTTGGPETMVRVELERGRLLRSAGSPDPSWFERAASAAAAAGLAGLYVDALHMLALVAESPEAQVQANQRALDAARASSDDAARRWEASLLNNLGCALVDAGRTAEALVAFEEALDACRVRGGVRQIQIARWMVGWTLRLLGRHDEALALQLELKSELDASGLEDQYVDEELRLLRG